MARFVVDAADVVLRFEDLPDEEFALIDVLEFMDDKYAELDQRLKKLEAEMKKAP